MKHIGPAEEAIFSFILEMLGPQSRRPSAKNIEGRFGFLSERLGASA
jgi:hypothetical protein